MIMKGQKINDRYQIIKSIGEGGMANVYLAYDTILDRNVAVKVLRGDLATDEKFVRRFQREALSASSLSHPNIVEVYDVGEDNGQYYIVMEYIEGCQLKQLLKKRGRLTLSEVIDIMLQITDGLSVAHDAYIIHRDIKPQNIMILDSGLVKITDFGIAMAMNSTQLTQTNSVMGSVHYLPPEQANGKGSTLQSDIYSMGILMYELLTGELPYKGDNAVEIALKHLKEKIPSVREKLPEIPQSVENIIIKATAKNPKNRYADARSMNEDLRTCLDDSRANEPKIVLPYPEFDEDRKPKSSTKSQSKNDAIVKEIKTEEVENTKRDNKVLITLFAVFTGIVIVITSIIVLLPIITNQKEIKVPDVSGLDISDAINTLQNEGFKIADQQKEQASDEVPEGKVVKTNPVAGVKKTKGSEITLYISTGNEGFTMEDFTGKNYYTVYGTLTAYGILVIPEKRDVSDAKVDASTILDQSVKAGEKVSKGDTVILYIPNVTTKYPNFTSGDYTKEQIEQFCTQYSINCKFKEVSEASGNYKSGDIIAQSRPSGTQVTSGASLTITIYVKEDVAECNPNEEVCE
ncbi:putative serine/threonine-specific protein kinase [Mycoplasma sp. CAG:956]|nr:putative serine/threonine-specific protein kinase [Mycoplasma sp. CAG:956]